jgi:hypothetical protein
MIFAWLPGLLIGFSIIASGQALRILMDIRKDVHLTRRYVRRFGLYFARGAEDKTE